jgi:DNA-directed RNA polymerase subunit RPC12/RpoP
LTDPSDKIIVFCAYDTIVEANLAKTKLDAYGIPCFLTGENFVGLYPIRNEVFPGVRLHIFETDFDLVKETLTEVLEERSCPYCQSKNIDREVTEENKSHKVITALTSGILFPDRMVFKCRDCLREFEYQDD